jgi:hypothetical protein
MAFVATATAVGFGSAVLGTAIIGAGVGGLYSAITKDGDVLNSMLTGGLLGATAGTMLPAAAGTTAAGGAAAGAKTAAGASTAGGTMGGVSAGGAFTPSAASAANFSLPPLGMTGGQKLAAGLAGTTALSLLGSRNQPTLQQKESESSIRPYTYSQKINPNYGQPGESYFTQSYEAGEPYKAASGGIMRMADGGAAQPVVPMQQLAAPVTTYGAPQAPPPQAVTDYNKLLAERAQNEYNVQPAPLSTLPGGGQYAGQQDVNKIINRYYQENLGRSAEKEGLDYWTSAVRDRGMKLGDAAKAIRTSPEGTARQAGIEAARRQQEQAALESSPQYKDYMSAPINQSNFDAQAYLAAHPDVARAGVDPFQHYQQYGIGEGRAVTRLPFQQKSAQSGQSGYTYNPVTKSFTAPTAAPTQDGVGLPNFNDPGFQSYLQNQYNQYQQSQSGGGAAGGLMPNSLRYAMGGDVQGYNLGGYSDGGRLLRGPGDGVSDDIPATIGNRQPARLADGEFVIPARIVSEIGNGSTDAGAKRLYAMMDRIQAGRKKTVGKGNVAKDTKAKKHLLA